MRTPRPALAPLACALAVTLGAAAQDAPTDPPEQAPEAQQTPTGLVVRDLVVMQADLFGTAMNDPGDFDSTYFNDAPRRRRPSDAPNTTPMPLGLITLDGEMASPTDIRIAVAHEDGRFLGHWPKGVASDDYLVWFNLRQVETPAGRRQIPAEHWLSPIRDEPGRMAFNTRDHIDRFLTYDATFPYQPPLAVEGKQEEGYTITGEALAGVSLAMLTRRGDDGWLAGAADPATGRVALQQADDEAQAIAPILALLEQRGYNKTERETAAAILREAAFGDASMSLIYVIGSEQLDAMLPLTLRPEPAVLERVGIIVVNNVEPDIINAVNRLITQLGDDDWATRNAAQRALIEMDRASIEIVRRNADHEDPEVAYRIEQVIAAFDKRHP